MQRTNALKGGHRYPPSRGASERFRGAARQRERRGLILVVEDNPHDWEIYGKILWYNGFDVIYAADGAEGLRLAREHAPDLLLVDLLLPGMDGLELCRRCRAEPMLAEMPIIMLTARDEASFGDLASSVGCDLFLEKPQSPTDVLRRVEALVGRQPPSGEDPLPTLRGPEERGL